MPETMKRLWAERKVVAVEDAGKFVAKTVADFGNTQDGDTVLRIGMAIEHWIGLHELEQCDGVDCNVCSEFRYEEVILDSVRRNRQEAIRLAIQHADGLFERFEKSLKDVRQRFGEANRG